MKPNSNWAIIVAVVSTVALVAVVVHSIRGGIDQTGSSKPTKGPLPLTKVQSWAIQVQDVEVEGAVDALASSRCDMLVVDPTCTDWSEQETKTFDTAGMVCRLKATAAHDGVHRKLVLAFINIGEAEEWRWYWKGARNRDPKTARPVDWPSFLLEPDPEDTGGDHPVAFWENDWKNIVLYGPKHLPGQAVDPNVLPEPGCNFLSLIDEALRDGFDGVCLDWVEAYGDDRVVDAAKKASRLPATEMAGFLSEIRQYARARNPEFLILQTNAADLPVERPDAVESVDGVVQEGIWFYGATDAEWADPTGYDQPTDSLGTDETLANLKLYRKAGKPVFDLEYAVEKAHEAATLSRSSGLTPYCSRAALNQLSVPPAD